MSENMRTQSEMNTYYEVYRLKGELLQLREQNRVLREVLDDIRKKSYEPDPERPALSTRAEIQLMAEAALTATSQPYSQATLSCGHHSGKVANHCLMCGEEDATSQEGQHG